MQKFGWNKPWSKISLINDPKWPSVTVNDTERLAYDNLKHTLSSLCSRQPFRDTLPFGYYPFINNTFNVFGISKWILKNNEIRVQKSISSRWSNLRAYDVIWTLGKTGRCEKVGNVSLISRTSLNKLKLVQLRECAQLFKHINLKIFENFWKVWIFRFFPFRIFWIIEFPDNLVFKRSHQKVALEFFHAFQGKNSPLKKWWIL